MVTYTRSVQLLSDQRPQALQSCSMYATQPTTQKCCTMQAPYMRGSDAMCDPSLSCPCPIPYHPPGREILPQCNSLDTIYNPWLPSPSATGSLNLMHREVGAGSGSWERERKPEDSSVSCKTSKGRGCQDQELHLNPSGSPCSPQAASQTALTYIMLVKVHGALQLI